MQKIGGLMKKKAFTLAEVLITLGIIGIVAAMTLPTLVTKYRKQQTVTHLKKVYTSLNQALRLSEAEFGPYEYWSTGYSNGTQDVHEYYEKYWYPRFKVLKSCETFSACGYKSNNPYKTISGGAHGHTYTARNVRVPFIIADGTSISISIQAGEGAYDSSVYIDLNGSKEPNMFGIDVFAFVRLAGKGIMPSCYAATNSYVENDCKNNGYCCTAKIVRDGWEIKDNYPWK